MLRISLWKQLNRLEVLASFPLASFGPHLVQVNEGSQVIVCEVAAILSHLVTPCGEETIMAVRLKLQEPPTHVAPDTPGRGTTAWTHTSSTP